MDLDVYVPFVFKKNITSQCDVLSILLVYRWCENYSSRRVRDDIWIERGSDVST
jgi:hypothetical protein